MRLKLAALWTTVMFLYIYNDYFQLWQPGALAGMMSGKMAPFGPVTQPVLLGIDMLLVIPSLMIFLSVALPHHISRWLNVVVGVTYTLIEFLTIPGAWRYYQVSAGIEVVLTGLAIWYALHWRVEHAGPDARMD